MTVEIPAELRHRGRGQDWARWLADLPRLIRDVLAEWSLTPDGPARFGDWALVVPVTTARGNAAAAKFAYPLPETRHEHLALRAWGGEGAVRLLQADPHRSVLLLERAHAGQDLTTLPVLEACEVVAGLYRRLHRPAIPQLDLLSAHSARWADELAALRLDRLVPRRYVDQGVALARDFASDPAAAGTLLHTDLHSENVLAADREPWLVIDPNPLSGDPAYEVAPMLENRWNEAAATGSLRQAVLARMFTLVDAAELDEERVRAWVIVRELVNVLRTQTADPPRGGDAGERVTTALTIVKAVQR